ncbi:tetratricopeptide repeat protein, partial [Salmonella enterica subsp. enterica serovar Weltevreden]|nr:tetratricopeptide repeat protein [Salmonella enterica subsp. enterica serovar Weltevreden]
TKTSKPEHLVLKGNALYRLERYPEAAQVLKQALESGEPRGEWQQLLMATYIEMGNTAEAAKLAEQVAQKNPTDKRAQMNLVATY